MSRPTVCVLALTPLLTVTIEAAADGGGPEVHVHPGGQGVWVGRLATALGADAMVCGPFGGETGDVVEHLAVREGLTVHASPAVGSTGAWVHDRRSGERAEVARMDPAPLGRHALDDVFGSFLVHALECDVAVLTGAEPADVVPGSFFTRTARDLRDNGRTVVADLAGGAVRAVLAEGLDLLKMSHSEMVEAGLAAGADLADLVAGGRRLVGPRVPAVVVSRASEPTLLIERDTVRTVTTPPVTTVDHRGAGDSMTAGLAVGLARGMSAVDAVRLAAAAGALNATRRGLGTGHRGLVERFAEQVTVEELRL